MADSFIQYTASGSTDTFNITFGYLDPDHVSVELNGVDTAFSFPSESQVQIDSGNPTAGVVVAIIRTTPRDAQEIVWQNAANLTASDLNTSDLQMLYITQEAFDTAANALLKDSTGVFDATSLRIKNVATPSLDGDAVNKAYADTVVLSVAGNVTAAEAAQAAAEAARDDILGDPGFIAVAADLDGVDNIGNVADNIDDVNTVADQINGAGFPVTSVNGETGVIVLDTDDISEGSTNLWFTAAEETKLAGIATGAEVNQNAFNTFAVSGQSDVVADSKTDTVTLVAGTGMTITTNASTDTITLSATAAAGVTSLNGETGAVSFTTDDIYEGSSYKRLTAANLDKLNNIEDGAEVNEFSFKTITVSGQTDVVADSDADTLTFVAGTGMTLTTSGDTITFESSGGSGEANQNAFSNIAVSGQTTVAADNATDTVTFVAGDGITITTTAAVDFVEFYADVVSVNGATGTVVIDADDISDTSTTNKFVTATDITKLSNLSGTNSGDQTITLTGDVTGTGTGSFAATVTEGAVTQHEAALTITESQISDLGSYLEVAGTPANGEIAVITAGGEVFETGITVTYDYNRMVGHRQYQTSLSTDVEINSTTYPSGYQFRSDGTSTARTFTLPEDGVPGDMWEMVAFGDETTRFVTSGGATIKTQNGCAIMDGDGSVVRIRCTNNNASDGTGTSAIYFIEGDIGNTAVNAIGSIGGGTQDIDLAEGHNVTATVDTSETTFTFTSYKEAGFMDSFLLMLTNGGSQTVNFPASVVGTMPALTASGEDHILFYTYDGGTSWYFSARLDVTA